MIRYITILIILILIVIYFTVNFASTGIDFLDYQLRGLYHANLYHLLANSVSFIALSGLESAVGSMYYLLIIIFIFVVSNILLFILHAAVPNLKVLTVGFSGAVFGLAVVYAYVMSKRNRGNFIVLLLPLLISLVPQFFVPNISIEGHICGIIAGLLCVLIIKYVMKDKIIRMSGKDLEMAMSTKKPDDAVLSKVPAYAPIHIN